MRCADCGQDFPHLSALTKHKEVCPARDDGLNLGDTEPVSPVEEGCVIPLNLCPEEVSVLAMGQMVPLRVGGILTPDGVRVQEVTFIR